MTACADPAKETRAEQIRRTVPSHRAPDFYKKYKNLPEQTGVSHVKIYSIQKRMETTNFLPDTIDTAVEKMVF